VVNVVEPSRRVPPKLALRWLRQYDGRPLAQLAHVLQLKKQMMT
jgi:hypothetical protein